MTTPNDTWTVKVEADTTDAVAAFEQLDGSSKRFGKSLSTAFDGLTTKGKGFGDVLRALALDLSRVALQQSFKPLQEGLSGLLSNLVGGGALGFARGGAFQHGTPVPFAAGGVIASPVTFPLAGGRTGLAGERGPEAILPLARGSDGRLGVATSNAAAPVAVTVNITTPDVDGFRRSQGQVAAALARAVAGGNRNL
jgi:phage-related minor tail protein